ncbi:hypothetical protein BRD04_04035 [Halobacteriales archaeon QS_9_67_17]|nr:MAG: hypothetical protein BRD04_04035 [Halobacteriales archaeon QS_9_67_17]
MTEAELSEDADARLADALERVAHGAVVSVPSLLAERLLVVAFTALLTNGFSAAAYGLFVLARRGQRFLAMLALGFRSGLSRYLPNAADDAERNLVATFGSLLVVSSAVVFGVALFLAAPTVAQIAGEGAAFEAFVRAFGLGLPGLVWLRTAAELLRGLEEVWGLNLALRVGFPALQLGAAGAGVLLGDLLLVAVAVPVVAVVAGGVTVGWLARERGLRPQLFGVDASALHRRYARYTLPLFVGNIATTVQRLGFYPLIALFLTGTAGGVFAVGALVGLLVRLPLMGINQFMPPVAAALHGGDHREALSRLYGATSRLVLVGVTGLSVPAVVFRVEVMALFGPTFVRYADLLPAFVLAQWVACAAGSVGILLKMTDNQRALLVGGRGTLLDRGAPAADAGPRQAARRRRAADRHRGRRAGGRSGSDRCDRRDASRAGRVRGDPAVARLRPGRAAARRRADRPLPGDHRLTTSSAVFPRRSTYEELAGGFTSNSTVPSA